MTRMYTTAFQQYYRLLFFAGLYMLYIVVLFGITDFGDAGHIGHDVVRVLAPALELGLAAFLCAASVRAARRTGRGWWLLPAAAIAAFIAVVYFAQTYSLYLSNNFISVLALQNTDSVSFVKSARALLGFVVILVWIMIFWLGLLHAGYRRLYTFGVGIERWSRGRFWSAALVLLALNVWLLGLQNKSMQLEPGFRQVPVSKLLVNVYTVKFGRSASGGMLVSSVIKAPANQGKKCFTYSAEPGQGAYPFQKGLIYKHALPFPAMAGDNRQKPNVIVIFTEGLSARMVDVYGSAHPGLTPNIDRLATQSMRVVNYFNHTAATYRGLIGQLSSGYSLAGGGGKTGWETGDNKKSLQRIHRRTMPMILNERGYQSFFFSPHRTHIPFTQMLKSLGFDHVFTRESIGNGLLHGQFKDRGGTDALDDQSLFAGLVAFFVNAHPRRTQRRSSLVCTLSVHMHSST